MKYKVSKYNHCVYDNNELLIVNFRTGLSSFRIITGDDIDKVNKYLACNCHEINIPNNIESMLIDGEFLIPDGRNENVEVEMRQMDYIYNSKLQLIVHVTTGLFAKYCN